MNVALRNKRDSVEERPLIRTGNRRTVGIEAKDRKPLWLRSPTPRPAGRMKDNGVLSERAFPMPLKKNMEHQSDEIRD